MFENELTLNTFCRDYLKTLANDLSNQDLTVETNGKTPQWILGHLRVVADMPRGMVGLESVLDPAWGASYGPGSKPGSEGSPIFEVDQIVSETVAAYEELTNASQNASADVMSQPHGLALLEKTALKTNGDLLSHILSTHFMFHLAQLSACRQAKGNGPLF